MFEKPQKAQVVRIKIEAISLDSTSIAPSLDGRLLADGCLWGLAPQSIPSPTRAVHPSSAFGELWEQRLPANPRQSVLLPKLHKSDR